MASSGAKLYSDEEPPMGGGVRAALGRDVFRDSGLGAKVELTRGEKLPLPLANCSSQREL